MHYKKLLLFSFAVVYGISALDTKDEWKTSELWKMWKWKPRTWFTASNSSQTNTDNQRSSQEIPPSDMRAHTTPELKQEERSQPDSHSKEEKSTNITPQSHEKEEATRGILKINHTMSLIDNVTNSKPTTPKKSLQDIIKPLEQYDNNILWNILKQELLTIKEKQVKKHGLITNVGYYYECVNQALTGNFDAIINSQSDEQHHILRIMAVHTLLQNRNQLDAKKLTFYIHKTGLLAPMIQKLFMLKCL